MEKEIRNFFYQLLSVSQGCAKNLVGTCFLTYISQVPYKVETFVNSIWQIEKLRLPSQGRMASQGHSWEATLIQYQSPWKEVRTSWFHSLSSEAFAPVTSCLSRLIVTGLLAPSLPISSAQAPSQLLFPRGLCKAEAPDLWCLTLEVNDYQLKQNTCLHVASIVRGFSPTSAGPPARCVEGFSQAVQFTKYESSHIKAF